MLEIEDEWGKTSCFYHLLNLAQLNIENSPHRYGELCITTEWAHTQCTAKGQFGIPLLLSNKSVCFPINQSLTSFYHIDAWMNLALL